MKFDKSADFPYKEREQRTPTGGPLAMTGAILLLYLGAVLIVFVAGLLICWGMGWPIKVAGAGAGATAIFLLLVVICFYENWPKLFYSYEKTTGHDINKDGAVGPPQVTHFELPSGPRGLRIGEIDVPPPVLIDWCRAAASGQSTAYNVWIPRFSLPDGTGGRERYAAFRQWLCEQDYAREVGGNVGLSIDFKNPEACDFVYGFARALPEDGRPLLEGD